MVQPLFLDVSVPDFLKEAAYAARLGEQPDNWPQELSSELFKQLPFLSDYNVNVNLDRVDPGRGFAFGYADISNLTERPEVEHEEMGIPHIRIPLIVQDRSVKPFSVFLNGEKVLPLTEERVRETLFSPATFDLSTAAPRDPSLIEPLMPPQRSGMGMGGEYKLASASAEMIKEAFGHISKQQWDAIRNSDGVQKEIQKYGTPSHPLVVNKMYETAAKVYGFNPKIAPAGTTTKSSKPASGSQPMKKAAGVENRSLLLAIAPTLSMEDAAEFYEKLASDQYLLAGFRRNGIAPILVEALDNTPRVSTEEKLASIAENIIPTVVTVQKLPGGEFLFKSASAEAFAPDQASKGQTVPEQEAGEAIGQDQAQSMMPGQTATAVSDPVEDTEPMEPSKCKPVEEFGQYKVMDELGNSLLGHVFPTTLGWDGTFSPQPTALFTNGSAYAFQDGVMGELVGKGTNLPDDEPRGDGCFYVVDGGDAVATQPLTIGSSMAGPDGLPKMMANDSFGNPLIITQVEGLQTPQHIDGNEFAIPQNWKFMRLNNPTKVAENADTMSKTSAARAERNSVELFYNGGYQLVGGCGLEKLSTDYRYDLDPVSAEFMLGLLGVDGATAKMKVAEARKKGKVKLSNLHTITLLSERFGEATKVASALLAELPTLRKDLVKEAAALDDENTVDKILALNFINPESLATFIDYIPELERTSEELAEMLLFSYLGMNELPEGAISRSMKAMEEVIVGLKGIAGAEA